MTRVLLAAIGIAAMATAGLSLVQLPPGFPDGYVSPYDQATGIWATGVTYALLLCGIFTLVAAVMGKLGRGSAGAVLCVVLGVASWGLKAAPAWSGARPCWNRSACRSTTGTAASTELHPPPSRSFAGRLAQLASSRASETGEGVT